MSPKSSVRKMRAACSCRRASRGGMRGVLWIVAGGAARFVDLFAVEGAAKTIAANRNKHVKGFMGCIGYQCNEKPA